MQRRERELNVMPVFYDVDPSDVRKQKGDFGEAFGQQEKENINKAQLWKNALIDASNIAGWEPKYIANGHESKVINGIVHTILDTLSPLHLEAKEDLVGMKTRLENLKPLLDVGSDGVRMVGIWGVGGGGKTTLASSLYTEISCYFEGHHFIENIREESSKYGLKKLQENLLSALSKTGVKVDSIVQGKGKIKSMLSRRRVLVLLDDVDELDQLQVLAGSHDWFGSGSRIIITTRDEHLLKTHKVDEVCHVTLLSNDEAMQLFNRYAYNEKVFIDDYETLSLHVISYVVGLPLALKVLGSFLYDKDKKGWISTLDRLNDIPEAEIVEKLKISYDGLKNIEKELFLDIACFWRRKSKDNAMEILEACDFYPEIGIEVIRQKALISIVDGRFDMHDLVQEMGHYIVRGESPNNPEKHTRIWKIEEINNMCLGNATMENVKIEAIKCNQRDHDLDHSSQLHKIVSNIKELRYFDWDVGYSARSPFPFPDGFQPVKLVVLNLNNSYQKELWKGCKRLPHLKVLQLDRMWNLLRTPDFGGLPCLQKLLISRCYKLKTIHKSLGNHKSLQHVKVSSCNQLRMFPTIAHMKNLKTLKIKDCDGILEFPKIQANMESLVKLSVRTIGIEVLPSSIGERCTNLISLKLSFFRNLKSIQFKFDSLKHLKVLKLQGLAPREIRRRGLSYHFLHFLQHGTTSIFRDVEFLARDIEIPPSIIELSNLQELDLSWNNFSRLDFSLSQLTRLKLLNMTSCEYLLELPELPPNLHILKASRCTSLTTFGDCHKNCRRLCQVSLEGGSIINDGDKLLEFMLEVCMAIENHCMLLIPGDFEIAKAFTPPLHRGRKCTLQLPENWHNEFSGFLMCVVSKESQVKRICVMKSMNDEMNDMDTQRDVFCEESHCDKSTWVCCVSFGSLRNTTWWDQTYKGLQFEIKDNNCSGFGVRLIEKKITSGLSETSTSHSSGYTPKLLFAHDSRSALIISLLSHFTSQHDCIFSPTQVLDFSPKASKFGIDVHDYFASNTWLL